MQPASFCVDAFILVLLQMHCAFQFQDVTREAAGSLEKNCYVWTGWLEAISFAFCYAPVALGVVPVP